MNRATIPSAPTATKAKMMPKIADRTLIEIGARAGLAPDCRLRFIDSVPFPAFS